MIKIIDLTNTYCANCDKKATHIHHIIPISVGGSNRLTNLVALCDDCHAKVHNLNFTDFHYLQRIGIAEAQAKGKHLGRPNAEYPNEWEQIYNQWYDGIITANKAMEMLHLKRTTFYKLIKQYKTNYKPN